MFYSNPSFSKSAETETSTPSRNTTGMKRKTQ